MDYLSLIDPLVLWAVKRGSLAQDSRFRLPSSFLVRREMFPSRPLPRWVPSQQRHTGSGQTSHPPRWSLWSGVLNKLMPEVFHQTFDLPRNIDVERVHRYPWDDVDWIKFDSNRLDRMDIALHLYCISILNERLLDRFQVRVLDCTALG